MTRPPIPLTTGASSRLSYDHSDGIGRMLHHRVLIHGVLVRGRGSVRSRDTTRFDVLSCPEAFLLMEVFELSSDMT